MRKPSIPDGGLYAITADIEQSIESLTDQVAAAIRGGAVIVQYRRKSVSASLAREELRAVRKVCSDGDALLIVNDDADLALAVGADGVHLGRDDGDWEALASQAGRSLLLGVSCYDDVARARRAASLGVDYVAFGSFFSSGTKPQARPCSLETLRAARAALDIPIVAIGGITPENGAELVLAGANFLAVISGLFAQPSIEAAAARYASLFGEHHV
jgi:thiamine-phosphate pyrophosphorylase